MPNFDDADKAWVDAITPDGSVPLTLVAMVSWIDTEGLQRWRSYVVSDEPVSSVLGLIEMGKLDVIARSETGLPIRYSEMDDDTQ